MRVSFLIPGLHYGGVCRWALTLAQHLRNVEVASIITMGEGTMDGVERMAKRIAPVYSMPIRREGAQRMRDTDTMRAVVKKACRHADALIVSASGALPVLADVMRDKARVLVSHVTPEWEGQASRVKQDVPHATHLVAVSKAAAGCFPSDREHSIIPNGVDLNRLVPICGREAQRAAWGIPQDAKVALWMGRFDQIKQPGKLLDALHHLPEEWYAVYAGCLGSPAEVNMMSARASEEHPGRVRFVPGEEHIGDFLAAADCLVITSKAESGPLVMLEAAAAGLPIVATPCHSISEFACWHTGYVTLARDDLAEKIASAPSVYRPFATSCMVNEFSAPVIAHKWESFLLNDVLDWHRERAKPQAITYVKANEKPAVEWKPRGGDRPKVAFLSPSLQASGGVEVWLQSLIDHSSDRIDWRILNITTQACPDVTPEILTAFGVPWAINDNRILSDADLVLAWGLPSARRWLKGYEGPLALVNHGTNDWTRRWIQALEPYAQHFVGVSKQAAEIFQEATVIHNGIDFARLHTHQEARGPVRKSMGLTDQEVAVGFIGRISDEKNPVLIAEACAKLGPRYRPVYFGRDGSGGRLTKLIDTNKGRIYAATNHIGEAYAALDCVVVASDNEGFSLVTVEALHAGCPLVSTPVGILPEIEEEHGQVAVPLPLKATADQLSKAILIANRQSPRVEKGKAAAREFSAEKMADVWCEFIASRVLEVA